MSSFIEKIKNLPPISIKREVGVLEAVSQKLVESASFPTPRTSTTSELHRITSSQAPLEGGSSLKERWGLFLVAMPFLAEYVADSKANPATAGTRTTFDFSKLESAMRVMPPSKNKPSTFI